MDLSRRFYFPPGNITENIKYGVLGFDECDKFLIKNKTGSITYMYISILTITHKRSAEESLLFLRQDIIQYSI